MGGRLEVRTGLSREHLGNRMKSGRVEPCEEEGRKDVARLSSRGALSGIYLGVTRCWH